MLCTVGCLSVQRAPAKSDWLERHPDTALRVLVWNVDRKFFSDNAAFQRVLRAVNADLLILDEMPGGVSADSIAGGLPATREPWHVVYGIGGGAHQRASIATHHPLQRKLEFDQLTYPTDRFARWLAPVRADRQERARDALLAGVAAVGGIIEVNGRRVLVVGVDLQCCGDGIDSPEEERRQFESLAIRRAINDIAGAQKIDAMIVGGDFNTVNGNAPISIMQRGATQIDFTCRGRSFSSRERCDMDMGWTRDAISFSPDRLHTVFRPYGGIAIPGV